MQKKNTRVDDVGGWEIEKNWRTSNYIKVLKTTPKDLKLPENTLKYSEDQSIQSIQRNLEKINYGSEISAR